MLNCVTNRIPYIGRGRPLLYSFQRKKWKEIDISDPHRFLSWHSYLPRENKLPGLTQQITPQKRSFLLFPALFLLWISSALGWIFLGIFILYFVLVLVIFSSANTIFNTALFIYANEGKVPHFYTKEELEQAFVETKKSA